MSTGTNEILIMPSRTETDQKIGAKTKKSKKKNKVAASISMKSVAAVVPVAASNNPTIGQVCNDLQERLKLAEGEDSGFGEANGHEESTVERAVECVQPPDTSTVVRSGPDEHSTATQTPSQAANSDPAANCTDRASIESEPEQRASHSDIKPNESSITYVSYQNELQMPDIMRLIQKDLSEPYSIYTYRYFIHNWPKLCFLAMHGEKCVGAIVCKLDIHRQNTKRGYIAMLAVDKDYRKLKIGTNLVQNAIQAMLAYNADEVVLETEITNIPALRLYENLGFVRDKRLFGYYLNGVDALRLKLWFR